MGDEWSKHRKGTYIRARNELYDNLPHESTFEGGLALIHMYKRKGTGAFYDDHWLNLICDEVNKDKFVKFIVKVNNNNAKDINELIVGEQEPFKLVKFYYEKIVEMCGDMKFYIGNPLNYLTNDKSNDKL
jgi:hypothetical protein